MCPHRAQDTSIWHPPSGQDRCPSRLGFKLIVGSHRDAAPSARRVESRSAMTARERTLARPARFAAAAGSRP